MGIGEQFEFQKTGRIGPEPTLRRCIHGGAFPCPQCLANRRWNAAAGGPISDAEFERIYAKHKQQ